MYVFKGFMLVVAGFQPLATLRYSGFYWNPAPGDLICRPYVRTLTVTGILNKMQTGVFN